MSGYSRTHCDTYVPFWPADYAPERRRYPAMDFFGEALGARTEVQVVPVPNDCVDGFTEAFYARPECFLETSVRHSQSAWGFVQEQAEKRSVETLGRDLRSGEWDERYGRWRNKPFFEGSLRLVVNHRRDTKEMTAAGSTSSGPLQSQFFYSCKQGSRLQP